MTTSVVTSVRLRRAGGSATAARPPRPPPPVGVSYVTTAPYVAVHFRTLRVRRGTIAVVNHEQDVPQPADEPGRRRRSPATRPTTTRRPPRLTAACAVELVREVEKHVAADGWDQHPRMFALARTTQLVAPEPALAEALGAEADDPDVMTPIEQEFAIDDRPLEPALATTIVARRGRRGRDRPRTARPAADGRAVAA